MSKIIAAIFVAAAAASVLSGGIPIMLASLATDARAASMSLVTASPDQPQAKFDRRPTRETGFACSSHSWPNYDQKCLFDLRRPANEARTVRIIAHR